MEATCNGQIMTALSISKEKCSIERTFLLQNATLARRASSRLIQPTNCRPNPPKNIYGSTTNHHLSTQPIQPAPYHMAGQIIPEWFCRMLDDALIFEKSGLLPIVFMNAGKTMMFQLHQRLCLPKISRFRSKQLSLTLLGISLFVHSCQNRVGSVIQSEGLQKYGIRMLSQPSYIYSWLECHTPQPPQTTPFQPTHHFQPNLDSSNIESLFTKIESLFIQLHPQHNNIKIFPNSPISLQPLNKAHKFRPNHKLHNFEFQYATTKHNLPAVKIKDHGPNRVGISESGDRRARSANMEKQRASIMK